MGVNGIYGLSGSGIDVESMVKVGMLSKQKEYDKMQQTYTKNEWTKQAYNEIYTKLTTFSTSTLTPYKLSSNMSAKTAVSSNENAVTATPNGNAVVMSHKVSVDQLSSSPYLVATQSLQKLDSTGETGSVKLQDYLFTNGTLNIISNTLTVNDANGKKIEDVDVDDIAFEFKFSDGTVDDKGVEKQYSFSYTYGDLLGITKSADGTLQYNENTEKTFNDFISDFNGQNSNIKASYDAVGGKFSFYNKYGGEEAKINFELTVDENREDAANEAIQLTTKTFFQGMRLAQSINGELLGQDENGNSVDFYSTTAGGYDNDMTYIGSGLPNEGIAAILQTNEENLVYDGGGNIATTETSLFDASNSVLGTYKIAFNINDTSFSIPLEEVDDGNGGTESKLVYTAADGTKKYNADITIGDFVDLINAQSDATKVKASFADGRLTLESTVKGTASKINITVDGTDTENDAGGLLNSFHFDVENDDADTGVIASVQGSIPVLSFGITGQYGSATIDGVKFDKLTDNSVTAYGVTYKLHNTTVDDSGKTQTVGINVEQDIDSIVDRVKSFVEDYNKLLGAIYDKYDEKQYKDYKPLTASQKEQMKDEQIEKWEEKAKSGLLYHDQTLSKIATKMREAISTPIEGLSGKYNSVYSLGISTTGIHGQLTLDEDKLRAALSDDSESVYNVFSTLSKDDTFSENGVAQRLSDVMIDATKLIKERAGTDDSINDDSDLGSLMRQLQNKMSDFKKLLDAFESKLYKKYDAMEVALSTLGTQLSFITGGQ